LIARIEGTGIAVSGAATTALNVHSLLLLEARGLPLVPSGLPPMINGCAQVLVGEGSATVDFTSESSFKVSGHATPQHAADAAALSLS